MYITIWKFQIKLETQQEFEQAYGSNGLWAALFSQAGVSYLGTELLQALDQENSYITIDRWASQKAYEEFYKKWQIDYEFLDKQCESLTTDEAKIGVYQKLEQIG